MIYVDTSVALAWILAQDRRPPRSLWSESVVSSRRHAQVREYRLRLFERGRHRA